MGGDGGWVGWRVGGDGGWVGMEGGWDGGWVGMEGEEEWWGEVGVKKRGGWG